MQSRLLNMLIIAVFLLPILAPITPLLPIQEAKAETSGVTISVNSTTASPGSVIQANVTLDTADCTQTNITVNISVNGVSNTVVLNRSAYETVYGACVNVTYIAYLSFVTIGGKVRVLVNTTNVDSVAPSPKSKLLDGELTENGQKVVITYGGVSEEIIFYKTANLVVQGRWFGSAYWIPRLCPGGAACSAALQHYNVYEWVIVYPGAVSGHQYKVEMNITDAFGNVVANGTFIFNATGKNLIIDNDNVTAFLEFLGNASNKTTPWYIIGNDFTAVQQPGSSLTVSAKIVEDVTSSTSLNVAAEAPIRFFVSIAQWDIPSALSLTDESFKITVEDADANLNSLAKENYTYQVKILSKDDESIAVMNVTLVETGPNTGVFESDDISILPLYGKAFNETINTITLNTTELRIDSCSGPCNCTTQRTIELQYHEGSITVEPDSLTLRVPQKCCPVQTLTIKIKDADLLFDVDDGTVIAATRISTGTNMSEIIANYTVAGGQKVPALGLSVYMVGANNKGKEMVVNLTSVKDFILEFYKEGDTVKAVLPLDYLNWTGAVATLRGSGYEPEKIMIIYRDIFTPDLEPKDHVFNVTLSPVDMKLDRDTLPVAGRVYSPTTNVNNYDYGYVNGTAQVIHVAVYDNASNTNCCEIDTIKSSNITLKLVKLVGTDTMILTSNTSILKVQLKLSDNTTVGTCYIKATDLTETGPDTGVFTGKILIYSKVGDETIAGCPSPWLDGAKLVITYNSPSSKSVSKEVTFKLEQATVEITPSGSATFGTKVKIRVYDPDANLDNRINDTTYIVVGQCCPTTGALITPPEPHVIPLHEVAPNSSIFEGEFVLDEGYANVCGTLCIRYVDPTPKDTTIQQQAMTLLKQEYANNNKNPLDWLLYFGSKYIPSGSDETQLQVGDKPLIVNNIFVKPEKGSIELYYTMPQLDWNGYVDVTNKVVPASGNTTILIVIRDADRNKNSTNPDTISGNHLLIKVGDIVKPLPSSFVLDEAKLNITQVPLDNSTNITVMTSYKLANSTGVFVGNITLAQIAQILDVNLSYLKGKTIEIIYQDPAVSCTISGCSALAGASQVVATVKVYYEEPKVKIVDALTDEEKTSYNCFCPRTGQAGDVIRIVVYDMDLLDWINVTSENYEPMPFDKYFDLSVRIGNNVSKFYSIGNLTFIEYENETVEGVPIPVVKYATPAVQLFCGSLGLPKDNYIVAPSGSIINVTYKGIANAVAKVGIVAINATQTASINATKVALTVLTPTGEIEVTNVVKQGSIVNVKVPVTYDPVAASVYAGGKLTVVMYVVDENGYYWWFDYATITATTGGKAEVTLSIPAGITSTLSPGTYTLKFYVVDNLESMKPLSSLPAAETTITIVSQ
ncbi:hypothetical protein PYJP_03000 [Pyrofollis japonicus]|uniref:hypothetical protein n=1 Tax=Pyrofollis japonicus TaxID=3060460 RepID=UPI00295A9178|nr:hypothetical protein [Pyrofollis japonicus]BEP16948.1 hypothetical protein PYJP_03000 [Pyrofollis japonicus]